MEITFITNFILNHDQTIKEEKERKEEENNSNSRSKYNSSRNYSSISMTSQDEISNF